MQDQVLTTTGCPTDTGGSLDPVIQRLDEARHAAQEAARWLDLLGFRAHAGVPAYSPSICHYAQMLDPQADDRDRLAACRAMLPHVEHQRRIEDLKGVEHYALMRPIDPFGLKWRTTLRGAILGHLAKTLSRAIGGFEEVGHADGPAAK